MTTNLTYDAEHAYRLTERLAILCGNDQPTPEQFAIALREADEACERIGREEAGAEQTT